VSLLALIVLLLSGLVTADLGLDEDTRLFHG
jgi:hypothetical protein